MLVLALCAGSDPGARSLKREPGSVVRDLGRLLQLQTCCSPRCILHARATIVEIRRPGSLTVCVCMRHHPVLLDQLMVAKAAVGVAGTEYHA